MRNLIHLITILFIGGIFISCSSSQQSTTSEVQQPQMTDHYTSSFPHQDVSEQLQDIKQSTIRITATGIYQNYLFEKKYLTLNDIKTNELDEIASTSYKSEESTAGTSIILDQSRRNTLLITCEHTISFPDTVIAYYSGENIPDKTFVKSISVRVGKSNIVHTKPNLRSFDILATDNLLDLALLSMDHESDEYFDLKPLSLKAGDSDFLEMGAFIYVLGFPKGYPMVTRGIASSSEYLRDRFFVTDALFNPGISGGLIVATKDNYESFHWIGMAMSGTASRENLLVPRPDPEKYSKASLPYSDSVFVQQKTRLNYGITQAIPINKIKEFLSEHSGLINDEGFSLQSDRFAQ